MLLFKRVLWFAALVPVILTAGDFEGFLTVDAGGKWLKWLPDQPSRAEITTQGYTGITLNARLNYKNIIRLYNLKYEFSNGIQAPTTKGRDELIKDKAGTAGYVLFHLLSDFLIPESKYNPGLMMRANYEDYRATVHFNDAVRYIPYNYEDSRSITNYRAGQEAEFYTRFNDVFFGVSAGSGPADSKYARVYIGAGRTMYQKPYTFHIGDQELEDTITDTRFTGTFAGIGIVGEIEAKEDATVNFGMEYHLGNGEMVLVKDRVDITQIASNNESSINYQAMDMNIEYRRPLIPGRLEGGVLSDVRIKSFTLQTPSTTYEEAYVMNQDYFFGIQVNLTVML